MNYPKFRTYHLAVQLYRACDGLPLRYHAKDQLQRASLSIVLNLAEGSSKSSRKDRLRFYRISLGSLREVQAILDLFHCSLQIQIADKLGAHLYRLIHSPETGLSSPIPGPDS